MEKSETQSQLTKKCIREQRSANNRAVTADYNVFFNIHLWNVRLKYPLTIISKNSIKYRKYCRLKFQPYEYLKYL